MRMQCAWCPRAATWIGTMPCCDEHEPELSAVVEELRALRGPRQLTAAAVEEWRAIRTDRMGLGEAPGGWTLFGQVAS